MRRWVSGEQMSSDIVAFANKLDLRAQIYTWLGKADSDTYLLTGK